MGVLFVMGHMQDAYTFYQEDSREPSAGVKGRNSGLREVLRWDWAQSHREKQVHNLSQQNTG